MLGVAGRMLGASQGVLLVRTWRWAMVVGLSSRWAADF